MVTATVIWQNNFIYIISFHSNVTNISPGPGLGSGNENRNNLGLERDHYLMKLHE